ncbi:tetraacyldisaccharide 4'-kinase [uncultured Polaribacter sp.]|uniref:tetraacyldisaccharide 4'-kinase n=1 Tax=uncultured Polaribacter sp. TaxID=174711 RepID=UPI0034509E5D
MMKILRYLLFPFAILYDVITRIRNLCFDAGFFKQKVFKIPIIVVGNLSVGGTGKTPQIEYLVRLLKGTYKVAIVSRGYGRKTKGYFLANNTHTSKDIGDEPLQYFNKFDTVNVAVAEKRVLGISNILRNTSSEIVLLDDAYQHRNVKGSFYVLLTKYNDLFVNDFLLPTGNLRESKKGAQRTDVIVVTKCPKNLKDRSKKAIQYKLKKYNKKIFFTTISYDETTSGSEQIYVNDLKNYTVLLVTGIANPSPMLSFLEEKEVRVRHLKFPDHHAFSIKEIQTITTKYHKLKASKKILLTTEKDYVRLSTQIDNISFLGIKTSFLDNKGKEFDELIMRHIQQNQR